MSNHSFSYRYSLVDCIWHYHVALAINSSDSMQRFPSMRLLTDIDQCRSMSKMALASGCLAEESVPHNIRMPTPLFRLNYGTERATESHFAEAIKELLAAGYDVEFRNFQGQTPLLFAALMQNLQSLMTTKLFLAEKADQHAVDNQGRGALHCCFAFFEGFLYSFREVNRHSTMAFNEPCCAKHDVDVETFADNACGEDAYSDDTSSEQEFRASPTEGDVDVHSCICDDAERRQNNECYWCDGPQNTEQSRLAVYYYCAARDVDDFDISDLIWDENKHDDTEPEPEMCKARLRLKLLALLQAGCNPNLRDVRGLTPSCYARREGLWPQWHWALVNSGCEYNTDTGLCESI